MIDQVDWPCEVVTSYSDVNLGCGKRIATGLDWVFANVPEAIVLEDDCLPNPTFFRYCVELLERYRRNERVHMISGCNLAGLSGEHSYYFSRCHSIWGWASWGRAWRHYDYEMRSWPQLRQGGWLRDYLRDKWAARIAEFWFDETYAGRIHQWDFQWAFSAWSSDAVSITPSVNLIENIGYGSQGTHLRNPDAPFAGVPTEPIEFPLRHPSRIEVLEEADRLVWNELFYHFPQFRPSLPRRWLGAVADRARNALSR